MSRNVNLLIVSIFTAALVLFLYGADAQPIQATGLFASPLPVRPPNDNFAKAAVINQLPYANAVNLVNATLQDGEPRPTCVNSSSFTRSVWYTFTPSQRAAYTVNTEGSWGDYVVALYTGNGLRSLSQLTCSYLYYSNTFSFIGEPGVKYSFQVGRPYDDPADFGVQLRLAVAAPPSVDFSYYPDQPSIYTGVQFNDYSSDPANLGFASYHWDLGDQTTSTANYLYHEYAADGDYTVQFTATTVDGRSATASRVVSVRTHDVAITKFVRPKTARAGQSRRLAIAIANHKYPENVRVELYRSAPGGYQMVGSYVQFVPVHRGTQTTDFSFNYTFTDSDAAIGKVTFKAYAYLENVQDALPADNEFVSSVISVKPRYNPNSTDVSASSLDADDLNPDDPSNYETDTVSNTAADAPMEAPTPTTEEQNQRMFMPVVSTE